MDEDTNQCRTHPYNSISLICKSCRIEVCTECIVTKHNGHQFDNMDERLEKSKASLRRYLQELESRETDIANAIANEDKNITDFEKEEKYITRLVTEAKDAQIKKINLEHTEIMGEIRKYSESETKDMNASKVSLMTKKDQIQALIKEVKEKLGLKSFEDVEKYQQGCPPSSKFEAEKIQMKFALRFQIHDTSDDRLVGQVMDDKEWTLLNPPNVEIMKSFTVKGADARSVKPISPNEAWVSFYGRKSKSLSLYNKSGKILRTIGLDFSPISFTISQTEEIIISDYINKSIKKVTPTMDIIQIRSTEPCTPRGIFINENNEPVVCLEKSVAIFTLDFKSIVHSIEKDKQGVSLFDSAIAATQNGTSYAVIDEVFGRVINVDLHGHVEWTYTRLFEPSDIVNYKKQMLIISDAHYHKIHILNTHGGTITIYSPGEKVLTYPDGLAISPDNVIWVTESSDRKKVHLLKITEAFY